MKARSSVKNRPLPLQKSKSKNKLQLPNHFFSTLTSLLLSFFPSLPLPFALPAPTPNSKSTLNCSNPQATFYGHEEAQDAQGACSFSENFANTNNLPWTKGISNTIALNDAQFANGAACGMCVMYQGTGEGIGTTPLATVRRMFSGFFGFWSYFFLSSRFFLVFFL